MIDFSSLLGSLGDVSIDDAGIRIEASGPVGSLIAELTSIDQTTTMTVDVPLLSVSPTFKGTGAHPFYLHGDAQAVVHLKNLASEPTTAIVQVLYEGGEFSPELVPLAPGQSVSIDIRKFRDTGARDVHGHQIPGNVNEGQVQWFQHGKQIVIGRLLASNASAGVSASFACGGLCCPPSFFSFSVDPGVLDGIPENDFTMTMHEMDYTCGQFYGPFNVTAYVSSFSSDPGIASVVNGNVVEMVDEGLTTINIDHWATTFEQGFTECESGPCERNCNESENLLTEALQALVRIPHHLVVVDDGSGPDCDGALLRRIIYRVVDRNGRTISAPMRLKEHFISVSQNTCGNGQPGASPCGSGYVTVPTGQFSDFLTVNCNSVGGSCGYDLHWQWQWCPARRAALPLGTFNGYIHHDQINVNGNTTRFQPGTEIFP